MFVVVVVVVVVSAAHSVDTGLTNCCVFDRLEQFPSAVLYILIFNVQCSVLVAVVCRARWQERAQSLHAPPHS
jgi:hypothetical protein